MSFFTETDTYSPLTFFFNLLDLLAVLDELTAILMPAGAPGLVYVLSR